MTEKALSDCGSICNQIESVRSFHYKISGTNGLHRKISLLNRRDLEYEYLNIYDEVTHLKTQINVQQDKIKKLITKLLRITSQQKKIFGAQKPCCNANKSANSENQTDRIKELELANQKLLSKLNTLKLQLCTQKQLIVYKTFVKRSHVRSVKPLTSRLHGASCDCQNHCVTKEFIYKFTTRDGIGVINEDIEPESSSNTVRAGELTNTQDNNILILENKVVFLEKELEKLKPKSEQKIKDLENELEKLNTIINQKDEKVANVPKNNLRCICEKYAKADDTINNILKQQLDGALNSNGNLVEQLRIEKNRIEGLEKQVKAYKQKLDEHIFSETETNQVTELENEHAKEIQAISVSFKREKDNLQKEIQKMRMDSEALKGTNKTLNVKLNDLQSQLDALQVKFAGQNKTPRTVCAASHQKTCKEILLEGSSDDDHSMMETLQQPSTALEQNIITIKQPEKTERLKKFEDPQNNSEIIARQPKSANIPHIVKKMKRDQTIKKDDVNIVTENLNKEECNSKMDYLKNILTPSKGLNCTSDIHNKADKNHQFMPKKDWLTINQTPSWKSIQKQDEKENNSNYSEKVQEPNVRKISFQSNVAVHDFFSKDSSKSHGEYDANSSSNFTPSTSEDVSVVDGLLSKSSKCASAAASLGEVTSDSHGISSCDETDIYLTSEEVKQALKNIVKELCTCKDLLEHNQININPKNVYRKTRSAKTNVESDDTQNEVTPEKLPSKKKKKIKKILHTKLINGNIKKETGAPLKQSNLIICHKPFLAHEETVEMNHIGKGTINAQNSKFSNKPNLCLIENNKSELQTPELSEIIENASSKKKPQKDTLSMKLLPVVNHGQTLESKSTLDKCHKNTSGSETLSTVAENNGVDNKRTVSSVSSTSTTESVDSKKRGSKRSSIYNHPIIEQITSDTKSASPSIISNTNSTVNDDHIYPRGLLIIHFGKLDYNYEILKLSVNSKIFLTWQFYKMSSRFTPIKSCEDTTFNFTSTFKIIATPQLVQYMKNNKVCIEVHYTVENHSEMFATCQLPLTNVVKNPNNSVSIELCVDFISQNSSLSNADLSASHGKLTCECVLRVANDDIANLMKIYNAVPDEDFDVNNDFLYN